MDTSYLQNNDNTLLSDWTEEFNAKSCGEFMIVESLRTTNVKESPNQLPQQSSNCIIIV